MNSESNGNTNRVQEIDNIYMIRFKILDEFYGDYFYSKYDGDIPEMKKFFSGEFDVSDSFIERNIAYLMACGYIGHDKNGKYTGISMKGIKFVEGVTDGEFNYPFEKMKMDKTHIINKFQSGDSLADED